VRDEPDAVVLANLCDFRGRGAAVVVREILLGLRRLSGDSPKRFREDLTMLEALSTDHDLQDCIVEQKKLLETEIEKLPSYGIGRERGIMQGIEQGLEQGAAEGAHANAESLLRRLIASRFGVVDDAAREKLAGASTEQLNAWAQRVLSTDSVDDLFTDPDPS
jgi:flagellar biosynthesis/type III secretory pathway protein FliH